MKRPQPFFLFFCLIAISICMAVSPASAQSSKKVIVIKKEIDPDGNISVEKQITTGDDADVTLNAMDAKEFRKSRGLVLSNGEDQNPELELSGDDSLQDRNVNVTIDEKDGKKTVTVDVDGDVEVFDLMQGEEIPEDVRARLNEKGVIIGDDHSLHADRIILHREDGDNDNDFFRIGEGLKHFGEGLGDLGHFRWIDDDISASSDINCAALGVYACTAGEGGAIISNTIGASGAEEAGLQHGDVITAIDAYPVSTFRALHEALAMYRPGDVVAVTFQRDGAEQHVDAELRAWKDLPSFQNKPHAWVTCDSSGKSQIVSRKIIVIKKDRDNDTGETGNVNQNPVAENLELAIDDFTAFPNPSDGKFSVQFSAEPIPTVVSVYDASGKEVFRDKLENFSGVYTKDFDLTAQTRGALVFSVEQGGKVFTQQIILN